MTFTFRTIYTYCGAIPDLAGQWYFTEHAGYFLKFERHRDRRQLLLTHATAAKVMRE